MVEQYLGCVCVRWSTSEDMDLSDCGKGLEGDSVNVGEGYGFETKWLVIEGVHLVRSDPALHYFSRELPWSHHRFRVIGSTISVEVRLILKVYVMVNRLGIKKM